MEIDAVRKWMFLFTSSSTTASPWLCPTSVCNSPTLKMWMEDSLGLRTVKPSIQAALYWKGLSWKRTRTAMLGLLIRYTEAQEEANCMTKS